jgi:hypothetical protein
MDPQAWILIALGVIFVLLAVMVISIYNRLVALRNRCKRAFARIDMHLKRRYDLIPNLVEVAKGYMKHERETLEAVIRARSQAVTAGQVAAQNAGDPRASGQACVIIDGEHIYLGKCGTRRSWEKYHCVVAHRLNGTCQSEPRRLPDDSRQPNPTVDEVILAYWRFAQGYYVKNGKPTGETDNVRAALLPLRRLYGSTEAKHFGPDDLEVVRQSMIDADLSRKVINGRVSRVKRMFRWASKKRFVPPECR